MNLPNFLEYSLFENSLSTLRSRFKISDEEWAAMRINPEQKIPEEYSEYYSGEGAKKMTDLICEFVTVGIFGDESHMSDFMKSIAKVESCYGTNPNTYKRSSVTKGIFQLDKEGSLKLVGYKGIKAGGNYEIKKYVTGCKKKVKDSIGLNWDYMPYESLSKPLYNAIAARIFIGSKERDYKYDKSKNKLTYVEVPVPKTRNEQAQWWKDRYNTSAGSGTVSKFLNPPGCSL